MTSTGEECKIRHKGEESCAIVYRVVILTCPTHSNIDIPSLEWSKNCELHSMHEECEAS
jgi:hypothetical protein